MTNTLLTIAGFIVGGLIGLAFGAIQNVALRRNEKRQKAGYLKSGWMVMPGSMTRVAFLMIALVLVQIGMPMLFDGLSQWMVSAGVVLGYGWMLYVEYRRKVQTI
jgi:amino acid transporter